MQARLSRICQHLRDRLVDLVEADDRAAPFGSSEREDLLVHARDCAGCAEELRTYRATVDILRALPCRRAPPGFLSWVKSGSGLR